MVIGHQKIWQYLQLSIKNNNLSHAYLFSGLEKLGKKTLALEWISSILKEPVEKLITHPDLIFIKSAESEENKFSSSTLRSARVKKEIKISQIRDLIRKLSLKSVIAQTKVVIIDDAHLMNQEAQTCLLKTLEEPKGDTLLILITDKPQELYSTILSRVQIIKFYPVNNKEVRQYLIKEQVVERDLEEILKIATGRPGIAIDFVLNRQKIDIFREKIKEIEKISKADIAFRFIYVKKLSENYQKTREALNIWTFYFREKLIFAIRNQQSTLNSRSGEKNAEHSLNLRKILNFIQEINFLISNTNVNPKLALEALMLKL